MDEKEMIRLTRNSLKSKKSTAEIMKGFQKRGYKLEYAEKILSKAKRPKRIIPFSVYLLFILLCFVITSYTLLSFSASKSEIENPLQGIKIASSNSNGEKEEYTEVNLSEIEITPETISYVLNEIGAWKLKRNPLTFERPIINFQIDSTLYSSEIGPSIQTKEGLNKKADILFETTKEEILKAILSDEIKVSVKNSVKEGKTNITPLKSETVLFSKGYLGLYNDLK